MHISTKTREGLHRSIICWKKFLIRNQSLRAKVRVTMENQSTPMEFLLLEQVQFLEVQDDALSQWEFVDVVDTEEEGEAENCDDGIDGDNDGVVHSPFGSWDSSNSLSFSPNDGPIQAIHCRLRHPDVEMKGDRDADDDVDDAVVNRRCQFDDGDANWHGVRQVYDNDDDDDGEEDGDDDGYDLDDELVPWSVSNKFERQRMRKLGKRAFSKMHNSKRSSYLFMRPGCVHGKHGLGPKQNF